MSAILDYIDSKTGQQQAILWRIDGLISHFPGITTHLRWGLPFYYRKTWVCYCNPLKDDCIEWVFLRGKNLSNEQGILQNKGRKLVAGITFTHAQEHSDETLLEIFQEALLLDETPMKKTNKLKP